MLHTEECNILIVDNTMGEDQYFHMILGVLKSSSIPYKIVKDMKGLRRIDPKTIKGVILSGSPLMVVQESMTKNMDQFILNMSIVTMFHKVPILGICFGCQLLNVLFGGSLLKLNRLYCKDNNVYIRNNKILLGRFCLHYVIDKVASSFNVLGKTNINEHSVPCMIKHRKLPLYGILFHPEYHEETHYLILKFVKGLK